MGASWSLKGRPLRLPHEYVKGEPAKLLTLFHPRTGHVIGKGVKVCSNTVLHPWLKEQLQKIICNLPAGKEEASPEKRRQDWQRWQEGLKQPFTLSEDLPPLKILLILDNLTGHKSASFVSWLVNHGIMPLYTPIAGSWLNMVESLQNIIKKRALNGQHPKSAEETIEYLEGAVDYWDRHPTPFVWGGKRAKRREKLRLLRRSQGTIIMKRRPKINQYVRCD